MRSRAKGTGYDRRQLSYIVKEWIIGPIVNIGILILALTLGWWWVVPPVWDFMKWLGVF